MAFGSTPEGFNLKRLEDILESLEAGFLAAFGAQLDTSPNTPQGQWIGIFGSGLAECWELLEECYHGADPDAAAGYLLTALAGLTGTERRAAAPSTVLVQTFNLNAGVSLPVGTLVARASRPDIVFQTTELVENTGGAPADIYGPVECITTGPVQAPAGSLTVIVNPVAGWNSTTNAADALLGRDVDSDIILRQRREDQLALRGGSTVRAIKADLLDVSAVPELEDMRAVSVLENTTDATVDGLPPHSFEAVLDDGDSPTIDDDIIAQVIWDSKPAGIATAGGSSGTATDENGDPHTVLFSRVTLKPVWIALTITTTGDYPVDGDDQVKAAIALYGTETYEIDDDVLALALRAQALTVAGVTDVPTFTLGFAASPVGTSNLTIGVRERATFSTARISI